MVEMGDLVVQDNQCWILTKTTYNLGRIKGCITYTWSPYEKWLLEHRCMSRPPHTCFFNLLSEIEKASFPEDRIDKIYRGSKETTKLEVD